MSKNKGKVLGRLVGLDPSALAHDQQLIASTETPPKPTAPKEPELVRPGTLRLEPTADGGLLLDLSHLGDVYGRRRPQVR